MINNDILRSIRYMLDLSDNKVIEIIRLADPEFAIEKDELRGYLLKEDEPGHVACSDRVMAYFLDGLSSTGEAAMNRYRRAPWKSGSTTTSC